MNCNVFFRIWFVKEDFKFFCVYFIVFFVDEVELLYGYNYCVVIEIEGLELDEFDFFVEFSLVKKWVCEFCDGFDEFVFLVE